MYTRRNFIRNLAMGCAAVRVPAVMAAGQEKKPNIVVFISDDHGYRDSGTYGDKVVQTPNMDRLAKQGMKFTHAFAASPLCSPSRSVIETGLMPHRNGGHKFGTPIKNNIKTMPQYMKELGYYTAHIGKFHHTPNKKFPYDHIHKDENTAAGFIQKYDGERPLFLVVCTRPPHTPWKKNEKYDPAKIKLPPNFIDTPETRIDRANYYTDVSLMDSILGKVLIAIDEKGMKKETLFVYTTDQGANWPFAKWCVYDGGLRVPFIVRWPGKVKRSSESDAMLSLADIMPTCIEAGGGKPPESIDGRSTVGVLTGNTAKHRDVVFGSHTGNENGGPGIANHCPARTIRTRTHRYVLNLSPETRFDTHITGCKSGLLHHLPHWNSWVEKAKTDPGAKKIVDRYQHRPQEELYDIIKDPFEMNNIVRDPKNAELLNELKKKLAAWCEDQGDTEPLRFLGP